MMEVEAAQDLHLLVVAILEVEEGAVMVIAVTVDSVIAIQTVTVAATEVVMTTILPTIVADKFMTATTLTEEEEEAQGQILTAMGGTAMTK